MTTPRTTGARRRLLLMTPVLALALATGACSGDDKETKETKEGTGSETTSAPAADSSVPSGDNGDLDEVEGAYADLSHFKCGKKGGVWSATGDLKNTGDADATYLVQVTVHDAKAGTVFGSAEKTVKLKAGKKADFDLRDIYSGKEKKVDCTPRVVRGS